MTTALGTGFLTKPRWDKYDGYVGNFRAPLAEAVNLTTEANVVLAVGIDSDGAVVLGAGQTGIKGVIIIPVGTDMQGNLLDGGVNTEAGDICDVGKHGEIVNFVPSRLANSRTVTITDGTAGDTVKYTAGGKDTSDLAFDVSLADLKAALVALDDNYGSSDFTVTGTPGDTYTITMPPNMTLTAVGTGCTATVGALVTTAAAGTNYFGHADGSVTATKGSDGIYIGHTVEADRLIVNVNDEA